MHHTANTYQELIAELNLKHHPECGVLYCTFLDTPNTKLVNIELTGYYAETDRQPYKVPTPFVEGTPSRALATSIYYLQTYDDPEGYIHMNKSMTYHVLHQGRVEYTLITPGSPPRVEVKVMGENISAGESRLLLVPTNVWKSSRLLPEDIKSASEEPQDKRNKCFSLITEVVVPGFEFEDHKYMKMQDLEALFKDMEEGAEIVESLKKRIRPE
ncbi:hypothetical protein D9758_006688 [Tetrapyrgos nigripes]|uniref:DUF985 domain-containing protein n=1 Tax=Tetrapyrgos nigripes TaxID=182062 RepID=A0A8H5GJ80_9AGAR|nr:hypothetical protein D9758_006688 [Tetrapyrgos nigripes]